MRSFDVSLFRINAFVCSWAALLTYCCYSFTGYPSKQATLLLIFSSKKRWSKSTTIATPRCLARRLAGSLLPVLRRNTSLSGWHAFSMPLGFVVWEGTCLSPSFHTLQIGPAKLLTRVTAQQRPATAKVHSPHHHCMPLPPHLCPSL